MAAFPNGRSHRPGMVGTPVQLSLLKPHADEECMEGGAVSRLGGCRPRRVFGCEHEGGPIIDGDRELHREAAPGRAVHAKQPGVLRRS